MVSATSKKAYWEIKAEGITADQERKVFRIICMNKKPVTRKELADYLSMDASTVGARVNQLVASGHVIECEKRTCKITGRTAGTLRSK